jgi:hypothetical protein
MSRRYGLAKKLQKSYFYVSFERSLEHRFQANSANVKKLQCKNCEKFYVDRRKVLSFLGGRN